MRILYIADGRSQNALGWIQGIIHRGNEVHLVSSYPCTVDLPLASLTIIPIAFSGLKGDSKKVASRRMGGEALVKLRTSLRQWIAPLTFNKAAIQLTEVIHQIEPEIVHAMRIPYEGMVAARAIRPEKLPLLVSVWGNDFTFHAHSTPWMSKATRLTLSRISALQADCHRDIRLGIQWGFNSNSPSIVLPGGGGVPLDMFFPLDVEPAFLQVIHPRGVRANLRNDTFFKSIPLVLAKLPDTRFICPGMAGDRRMSGWVRKFGIQRNVDLMSPQPRPRMAELFRQSRVSVSPTTHDGTPNSLLEAMASGCFPVAGNVESLREWITSGVNGILVDPSDVQSLADALILGLTDKALRQQAHEQNINLVLERAENNKVMDEAVGFYSRLCS
jgi:hypothetical protein